MEMSAAQAHSTGSDRQLPDCATTEVVLEPQRALGGPVYSSGAAGNGQPDSEGAEGVSSSQSVQTEATGSRHDRQAESVGKLFDKELDNHHEEKLLLAQVATGADVPGLIARVAGFCI